MDSARDNYRVDYENLKAQKWVKEVDFMGSKTLKMNWDAIEQPPANAQEGPAVFYEKVVTMTRG